MDVTRKSEAPLFFLPQAVKAIPSEADPTTWRVNYIDTPVESVLGYPPEQWIDIESWLSHIHPEDRKCAQQYCQRAISRRNRTKVK